MLGKSHLLANWNLRGLGIKSSIEERKLHSITDRVLRDIFDGSRLRLGNFNPHAKSMMLSGQDTKL